MCMRMTISRTLNSRIDLSILPPLYFSRVNKAFIFAGQGSLTAYSYPLLIIALAPRMIRRAMETRS